MKDLALIVIHILATTAKLIRPGGLRAVMIENALLRQQLIVLRRSRRRAPNLTTLDRFLFGVGLFFLRPGRVSKIAVGLQPSTFLKFHQALVRRKYHRLFSSHHRARKPGPKGPSDELIRAIVELKSRNPRFGCPRIALIISRTFGVDIDKNVVRRVLSEHYREPPRGTGPSWLTFIGHAKDSLWSADLFRCESTLLQSFWVLVVMDQFTRRIVGFGVQRGAVDGPALCRMFNDATTRKGTPRFLSTDHDPLFEFHRWRANLRILEIDEMKTVPYTPTSHPFVERLIGTIRREFLDHTLFWNTLDLERKLEELRTYYNSERVHSSLNGNTPYGLVSGEVAEAASLGAVRWRFHCRGLIQLPIAA
ncbi:MAG: putative transposase [Gammaproteobacteria bacterium]|jgi:putative transposase